jgi:hypothetical protein
LKASASSATGVYVAFTPESLPPTRWRRFDPSRWQEFDGFSTSSPLLFGLPRRVSTSNLLPYWDLGSFAAANVTTVLVNADTGDRVPHWTERDEFDQSFGDNRVPMLILQVSPPVHRVAALWGCSLVTATGVIVVASFFVLVLSFMKFFSALSLPSSSQRFR